MKKALLVIDVQNAIVNFSDFTKELSFMEHMIHDFQYNIEPIIFMQHFDDMKESPLHEKSTGSDLHDSLKDHADIVIEKQTPNSFYQTELDDTLKELEVDHLFIVGFNTEFCCMFTAITAFDRGYHVTFIEDATGTVNDADTYEMAGLDIKDFIGTVLHWSNVIEVLDYDEYVEEYNSN